MHTYLFRPVGSRYLLPALALLSAGMLLLIPALLLQLQASPVLPPPGMPQEPISPQVWRELAQTRQQLQQALETPSANAGANARQHFRHAMATLPARVRAQPELRDMQAEAEQDFELLAVGNNRIRTLAAQQLLQEMARSEQWLQRRGHD